MSNWEKAFKTTTTTSHQ